MVLFAKEIFHQDYEIDECYYEKARNSILHSQVKAFFNLTNDQIVERYSYLNPHVNKDELHKLLTKYKPANFRWAGADLFPVTSQQGNRGLLVIETNSCPSGQKSFPMRDEADDYRGYKTLIEESFLPYIKNSSIDGKVAIIFDKNHMEALGYAITISEAINESVLLVEDYSNDIDSPVQIRDGVIFVKDESSNWIQIKAVFRYVTQKPWNRIPIQTKTLIYNPIIACLAGGRNKLIAAKAYDIFNGDLAGYGLKLSYPETIWDVSHEEIPLWVERMGGRAVIKIPYSNAGQGVFTITSEDELNEFMGKESQYEKYIVQPLIGPSHWERESIVQRYFHLGTIPNKKLESYIFDLRMMICHTPSGYKPVAIYARRAKEKIHEEVRDSWDMIGTNLSQKIGENKWKSDTSRLLTMDTKEFNRLGLSLDDLIGGYIQTVFAAIAIDRLSQKLLNDDSMLDIDLFRSLNPDDKLISEILK